VSGGRRGLFASFVGWQWRVTRLLLIFDGAGYSRAVFAVVASVRKSATRGPWLGGHSRVARNLARDVTMIAYASLMRGTPFPAGLFLGGNRSLVSLSCSKLANVVSASRPCDALIRAREGLEVGHEGAAMILEHAANAPPA
jgi:hypothetical protein